MATVDESAGDKPEISPSSSSQGVYHVEKGKLLDETAPWIDYAVQQALFAQRTIENTIDSAISVTKSRLHQIMSTSSAHLQMTIDSLQDVKSEYAVYEDIVFGKIKESIFLAASHPFITSGAVFGSGLLVLKSPRHYLYYNALRHFVGEKVLFERAEDKVHKLRESIRNLKKQSEELEKHSVGGEEVMRRGRTKLRHAGKQIQGVIRSAYKIERQAAGLKDILGELPSRDASLFRATVSELASEAKQERKVLMKEVTKISNYGISV